MGTNNTGENGTSCLGIAINIVVLVGLIALTVATMSVGIINWQTVSTSPIGKYNTTDCINGLYYVCGPLLIIIAIWLIMFRNK